MFSLREYREPKHRLPDRLPWAFMVAPGVVLQKDAVFQQTAAFRGPDLASSLDAELVSASARINNALRRMGSGWGLFVEAQRFASSAYPASRWTHPAAALVDLERRRSFEQSGAHFESSYYLTFTWRLPPDRRERAAALFYDNAGERGAAPSPHTALMRELHHFQKAVAETVDIFAGVFPEVGVLDSDQTLTYLHSTISTSRHPVRTPEGCMYLDAILPDMPFAPGEPPMLGEHFVCTSTVSGFPSSTLPGLLDALNHLPTEYRWVTRYLALDKADAKSLIEKYRKQWWSKRKGLWTLIKEEASKQEAALIDNAAANKAADADTALQELGDDLVSFGFLTTTVTVWDEDLEAVRRKSQRVKEVIQSRGFTVKDETLNSTHAWLGSLPGHVYANVRRPIVNSINLAHLMPLSSVWAGDVTNRHLESVCGIGAPHLYCSTTGSTPFRLHLAVGDVGHTLIIGPTGAGKSTLLGMLALGWLKYPGAQVIVFDKDRSARAVTLAVGGACYEPGNERAPVAFQPLADIDQKSERVWAAEFIAALLTAQSVPVDHAVQSAIDDTLVGLASAPRKERTLTVFASQIGSRQRALREALRPYTLDGNHGQIFDGDHDDVTRSTWTMIEMGRLMGMGPAVVVPALEYLFHRVEAQFDGRPTLMIVDEAWLFLGHPVFAPRLQTWLKTLRKKNVYVVFATQEVADATSKPELLSTILSACHTKIFLPDDEAQTPTMAAAYATVGLTSAEIEILARAQKKRDYYYRSAKGRRLFQLGLGPTALAFVGASSESDQQFLDETLADGSAAHVALALLERRGVQWAADELSRIAERESASTHECVAPSPAARGSEARRHEPALGARAAPPSSPTVSAPHARSLLPRTPPSQGLDPAAVERDRNAHDATAVRVDRPVEATAVRRDALVDADDALTLWVEAAFARATGPVAIDAPPCADAVTILADDPAYGTDEALTLHATGSVAQPDTAPRPIPRKAYPPPLPDRARAKRNP
jgi:type IV secretion system protein VirB4